MKLNRIEKLLRTKYIGREISYFECVTSTNDIVKDEGKKNRSEGFVVTADEQTEGRGRLARRWTTSKDESIAVSILLRPNVKLEEISSMTPVVALSIVEALKELYKIDLGIKWPNDIFLSDKKLGGILVESKIEGEKLKYVVVGIGLNINQEKMEEELVDIAASLREVTNTIYEREEIIAGILNSLERNYNTFLIKGIKCFLDRLREHSVILNRNVTLSRGDEKIEGIAKDFDEFGNLLMELGNGSTMTVNYGDISLRFSK